MKIKFTKQIVAYVLVFLVLASGGALIFSNRNSITNQADEAAGSASLSLSGGGAKTVGETFNVSALLGSNGNKICSIDFNISYPAELLELKSSTLGSPFSMASEQSNSAGSIHYQIGTTGCSTSNATILTMSFIAQAVGDATVAFSNATVLGGDNGQLVINASKESATVNISAVTATTTTTTTTPTTTTKKKTTTKTTTNSNTNTSATTIPVVATAVSDPKLVSVGYSSDAILDNVQGKAKGIVFTGTADPDNKINITIASDPILASTQSDAMGNWTYSLTDWLSSGIHEITMISEKDTLKSTEVKTSFVLGTEAKDRIAMGTALPEIVPEPAAETTKSKMSLTTIALIAGGVIGLLAIALLIIFITKRKHYLKVTKEITNSMHSNDSISHQVVASHPPVPEPSHFEQPKTEENLNMSNQGSDNTKETQNPFKESEPKTESMVPLENNQPETNHKTDESEVLNPFSDKAHDHISDVEDQPTVLHPPAEKKEVPLSSPYSEDVPPLEPEKDREAEKLPEIVTPEIEKSEATIVSGIQKPESDEMVIGYGQNMGEKSLSHDTDIHPINEAIKVEDNKIQPEEKIVKSEEVVSKPEVVKEAISTEAEASDLPEINSDKSAHVSTDNETLKKNTDSDHKTETSSTPEAVINTEKEELPAEKKAELEALAEPTITFDDEYKEEDIVNKDDSQTKSQ